MALIFSKMNDPFSKDEWKLSVSAKMGFKCPV